MNPVKHQNNTCEAESPESLRMSLAAAMTLGFKPGLFYRNAKLYCINLLLTYKSGCAASCSYCGLSKKEDGKAGEGTFIRVTWPSYHIDDITRQITAKKEQVKRICISMITNKRAVQDTKDICRRLRKENDIPVSLLVAPTIINRDDLIDFKKAGADKIGVAVDLATRELFMKYRGNGKGRPHQWDTYWQCLADAIEIFGKDMAGTHLMTGMGETEKQMAKALQKIKDMGGTNHLFSFFPETGSEMEEFSMPPMDQYRRIQVALYSRYQGKGRARELAQKMIQYAKDAEKEMIFALTIEPKMVEFFKSLGFDECDRKSLPESWQKKYDLQRSSKAFKIKII